MKTIGWIAAAGGLMVLVACGGGSSDTAEVGSSVAERAAPVRISGVVAGLMVKLPTNTASTSRPEWKGSMPNPT